MSKDAIIEGVFAAGAHNAASGYAFGLLVIAALFTSFYSWRLIFMTFYGETRDKKHWEHAHEGPLVMRLPLMLLAGGAVLAGMLFYSGFVGKGAEDFFGPAIAIGENNHVLHDYHGVPAWVVLAPFCAMLLGLFTAWIFYIKRPEIPGELAERHQGLYQFLLNKWYFDELYDAIFVNPAKRLGTFLWKRGDGGTVDGAINGLAMGLIPWVTRLAGRMQSGFLFHYAFVMLIGISILITLVSVGGGAGGAH